jgi:inosine/xanthosine triphosphate pyrophosphatase family protein
MSSRFGSKSRLYYVAPHPRYYPGINETMGALSNSFDVILVNYEFPTYSNSSSLKTVLLEAALHCRNYLNCPILITKTGLYIDALNGFPGATIGPVLEKIGAQGILKLLEDKGEGELTAEWKFVLAFAEPGIDPVTFITSAGGRIIFNNLEIANGNRGFDDIFLPLKSSSVSSPKSNNNPRQEAIKEFIQWYHQRFNR